MWNILKSIHCYNTLQNYCCISDLQWQTLWRHQAVLWHHSENSYRYLRCNNINVLRKKKKTILKYILILQTQTSVCPF